MTDRTPEAALAVALERSGYDGLDAVDVLKALGHLGWVLTPVAPEVPPPGLRERVAAVFAHYAYDGSLHSSRCSSIVYPGSTGPDPEPPDPCSCGGPEVIAALAATRTPEPPDSGPRHAENARTELAAMGGIEERGHEDWRAEPPDSGDAEVPDGWPSSDRIGWPLRRLRHLALNGAAPDAGIDAARLARALQETILTSPDKYMGPGMGAYRTPFDDLTPRQQRHVLQDAEALIAAYTRSGSPAPEGGE